MNNTLEGHRAFPLIAWTTVVCFAAFTYFLATNLQKDLEHIDNRVQAMETVVKTNSIKQF